MVKPTVISTFAGCGGSSLGYQMAGYRELLAVEWDDNAVETFQLNFPDVPVYHGDICKLTGDECMRLAGIKKGELDVLDGSPPCQGFSTAGKRKFNDPRNSLFREYARLLVELQPKVFVMENVTGMVKGCMKQAYLQIIKTLRECGYKAKGEVLNAMYYNVPQSRERVIIIGIKEDLGIEPSHPKPQGKPITVSEAWKGCKDKKGKLLSKYVTPIWENTPAGYSLEVGAQKILGKKRYFTHRKLSFSRPASTIQKSIGSLIYHPEEPRGISLGELKRLQSFPDNFNFIGLQGDVWARIGNSVPPNLMKAIAEHIKKNILKMTGEGGSNPTPALQKEQGQA